MRWQIGGNFGPVIAACENDWIKCPLALLDYIWFEVVTDVVDCLTNETILWRILAVLLICTTVVHLIYWQVRWMKEIKINKENLEQVDFKVQDLELKVNILTYKAQYGTWPFMHFTRKNTRYNLQNVQLAFSKLGEENSWIKRLWARNKVNNEGSLCKSQSSVSESNTYDVETKYISSTFGNVSLQEPNSADEKSSQISMEKKEDKVYYDLFKNETKRKEKIESNLLTKELNTDNLKLFKSSSEDHLSSRLRNASLGRKKNIKNKIKTGIVQFNFLGNDLSGIKAKINMRHANKKSKLFPTSIKTFSNTFHPNIGENMFNFSTTDLDDKSNAHETLYQVKEKLENLHSILQSYNSKNFQTIISHTQQNSSEENNNLKEIMLYENNTNNNIKHNCQGNFQNICISEICTNIQSNVSVYNTSNVDTGDSASNKIAVSNQIPMQITECLTNKQCSTFEDETDGNIEMKRKTEKPDIFTLTKKLYTQTNNDLLENNTIINDNCLTQTDNKNLTKNISVSTNTDIAIKVDKSNSTEIYEETNSDDKSTTPLLQEALTFKNELSSQIQLEKDYNEIEVENIRKNNKSYDYLNWQTTETHFQPKVLDMITEESSGSSSVDKRSNTSILRTVEESEDLLDEKSGYNDKNNYSIKYIVSKNEIVTEQEVSINDRTEKIECDANFLSQIEVHLGTNITKNISNIIDYSQCQETKAHKITEEPKLDFLELKTDLNFSNLTESESETSVNRLIDRLIESERKSKSARSSLDLKSKQDLAVDSLNNLIDSHNFIESVKFENEECDNVSGQFNAKKFNSFEDEKIIIEDNFGIDNDNSTESEISDPIETKVENSSKSMGTVNNMNIKYEITQKFPNKQVCNKNKIEGEILNMQENCLNESISMLDINKETINEKYDHKNFEYELYEYNENDIYNRIIIGSELGSNVEQENESITAKNISDIKSYNSHSVSDDNVSAKNGNLLHKSINENFEINSSMTIQSNFNFNQAQTDLNRICNDNSSIEQNDKNINKSISNTNELHKEDEKTNSLEKSINSDSTFNVRTANGSNQLFIEPIQSVNTHSLQENQNSNTNESTIENYVNFLISNDNAQQKNRNYKNRSISTNATIEDDNNKHVSDSYNNNKLLRQEFQIGEKISSEKFYETTKAIDSTSSSNDIESLIESNMCPSNTKLKCNQYHASFKAPTNIFSVGSRHSEQNVPKNHKNSGINSVQRHSIKSNYDSNSTKQLKAKSYLNLASLERTSPVSTHRRSKSYVTPRDISLNVKNNKVEKKNSSESLLLSNKTSIKLSTSQTPREFVYDDRNKDFKARKENSFESLSHSSISSSKSHSFVSSKELLINEQEVHFEIKKNNSLTDFSDDIRRNKNDTKIKDSTEPAILSNKSLKSYIPILKNRIEGATTNRCDFYSRSPVRGPVTMTMSSLRNEEKLERKNENEVEQNNDIYASDTFELQYSEHKRHHKYKTQNVMNEEQGDTAFINSDQLANSPDLQDKSVCPMMVANNEATNVNSLNSPRFQIKNITSQSWPLKINSKETEVLVKPSTLDISTSVSDLPDISSEINETNEFKIFEVPEELTKEEYITLLQMINENPEFEKLPNIDKLCSKLQLNLQE